MADSDVFGGDMGADGDAEPEGGRPRSDRPHLIKLAFGFVQRYLHPGSCDNFVASLHDNRTNRCAWLVLFRPDHLHTNVFDFFVIRVVAVGAHVK